MDWTTLSPGTLHQWGRCTLEVSPGQHPKRPWTWAVCWSEQNGIVGEAETLERAQEQAAAAATRVAEIDRRRRGH